MSDGPDVPDPDDPLRHLPPELRERLQRMGGADVLRQMQALLTAQPAGPVNWDLAAQVALQLAAGGDRAPTDAERDRARDAHRLAEHWLDTTPLPASPDAGRLVVASRQEWVNAALAAMRPLVEPVAAATTQAMIDLAHDQLGDLGPEALGLQALLPGGGAGGVGSAAGDLTQILRPMGAMLTGMHCGHVLGELARQLIGQYELGVPTAPRDAAYHLAVNATEAFAGWDLDATEVAISLALSEAAQRRLYHAVPWLEAHVQGLVVEFARHTEVDAEGLQDLARELMVDIDPDSPESVQRALARAGEFRLEPTPAQRRVLERLQGVVSLVQSWARREVTRAAAARLPNAARIDEVLRRRRAVKGAGEELLARLLGLDLQPDDETVGERFVAAVEDARGPEGLRRALAHPENLPDTEELRQPSQWLLRMAGGEDIPDDPGQLFAGLPEGPVEPPAGQRDGSSSDPGHRDAGDPTPGGDGEDRHDSDGDDGDDGEGGDDDDPAGSDAGRGPVD